LIAKILVLQCRAVYVVFSLGKRRTKQEISGKHNFSK
jgi:hypothetical protein